MSPDVNYAKSLLKLFLFHVHPDYFLNFDMERKVNESNIKSLTERLSSSAFGVQPDIRTLTFYIKPQSTTTTTKVTAKSSNKYFQREKSDSISTNMQKTHNKTVNYDQQQREEEEEEEEEEEGMIHHEKPKRIKIAVTTLYRLIDSIKNVLESLGVTEIPEKPKNFNSSSNRSGGSDSNYNYQRSSSGQSYEVKEFFDSLIDQRELISLRKDTAQYSKQLLQRVQIKLGVEKITMQSNLSSVNAYALISALLHTIEINESKLNLPWKGLELVISGNDIPIACVDAVEATICINPTQTPNQWMNAFLNINQQTFQIANRCKKKIEALSQHASKTLRKSILTNIETKSTRIYKNVKYTWNNTIDDIVIKLRRGYTCSNELYITFLETHFPLSDHHYYNDDDDDDVEKDSNNDDNVHVNFGNVNRDHEHTKAITKQAMIIEVIIEQGYGTKVLESGEIRLDANLRADLLTEFISKHTSTILTNTVRNIRRRNEIELLRQRVINEVGIDSLSRGVGITDDMFEGFLRMMLFDDNNSNDINEELKQRKRAMKNYDVRVSRYLGVSDDGFILVPWDVELVS